VNQFTHWTSGQDDVLRRLAGTAPLTQIARRMARTENAIKRRAARLGICLRFSSVMRNLGLSRSDPEYEVRYKDLCRFGGNKRLTLARTDGKCAVCQGAGSLVHHRDGNRGNNDPSNLLPLCRPCHARIHTTERERQRSPEELRRRTDYARSFITPEVARRRALVREQRKRERRADECA